MIAFLLSFLLGTNPFIDSDEKAIRQRMEQQISCWDAGDFDCFMEPYWNSDSLVFVGSGGLTYGWTQTLANYKKRYPDQEHRGELAFDIKQVKRLSDEYYYVIGAWHLSRNVGDVGGHYTLLWQKVNGEWFIIADHSS